MDASIRRVPYLWGAYKCMVKYATSNGDPAVAARRKSQLNFAWPWLERLSVAAGWQLLYSLLGPCDSWAFCSRDCEIRLPDMTALGIPYCRPTAIVCAFYIPQGCLYSWGTYFCMGAYIRGIARSEGKARDSKHIWCHLRRFPYIFATSNNATD